MDANIRGGAKNQHGGHHDWNVRRAAEPRAPDWIIRGGARKQEGGPFRGPRNQ